MKNKTEDDISTTTKMWKWGKYCKHTPIEGVKGKEELWEVSKANRVCYTSKGSGVRKKQG